MILDEIVVNKKKELSKVKREVCLEDLQRKISAGRSELSFKEALKGPTISLIAEVKKASPSAGVICEDFQPIEISRCYEECGVSAISVLTESKYFLGSLRFLDEIRKAVSLPILRKDFIFDEYQLYESKAHGADAVLLIAAILSDKKLVRLIDLAEELELDALVEVHTKNELDRVLKTSAQIIGINNRDLKTFAVDIFTTVRIMDAMAKFECAKERIIVSESGICTYDDVAVVKQAGADAVLVGEALMRGGDIEAKTRELLKGY